MAKINEEGFLELSGINRQEISQQLSSSTFPVLEGLSPLNLRILNQDSQVLNVAKGVEMMVAGDTSHDLYFIAQGTMTVVKKYAGRPLVIGTLKVGDFYGEFGVLRGKTRFASVYTTEPSVVIRVGLQAIQQVLDADADFKSRVLSIMKQRVLNSFLCTHVVFRAFSASIRDILSTQLTVSEVERGETLFSQGENADKYYIILSGEAEVLIQQSGKPLLLEIRRDNDILGEVRSDKGSKYGYTAVATNQLDLLALDKVAMQFIQQTEPEIVKRLQQFIMQQNKMTVAKMQSL
jgi:CRP-like cAMP-binding protein